MTGTQQRPAAATVNSASRSLATVAMHLLVRQTADIPVGRRTAADRRMATALAASGIPRDELVRTVRAYQRLSAHRRRALFDPAFSDLPVTAAIDVDRIRAILDRLGPIELPDPGEPRPFEVIFSHLFCDVQTSLVGSDEPFIVFGVVAPSELGLPPTVRTVTTPVYEDVDPGERRPSSNSQNLRLFGASGAALIDPDRPLAITASLFEHQPGDGAAAAALAVGLALVAAGVVLAEVPPVAAVLIFAGFLTFFLGPSFTGVKPVADTVGISLTAAEAASRTADSALVTLPEIPFGAPSSPRYRAVLQLRRG